MDGIGPGALWTVLDKQGSEMTNVMFLFMHVMQFSLFKLSVLYWPGKLAAQWTEKEHHFGARRAKSSNFLSENVEISVIHDWRDKRDGSAGQCKANHKQRSC